VAIVLNEVIGVPGVPLRRQSPETAITGAEKP
jgi:hypothetical protein